MYILLALVAACALGIAAHFLIDGRELRGAALTPGIATVVTAALYTGLQWAGLGEDNVWLWLASILGGVVVAVVATLALVAARRRSDAAKTAALGI
ncbi:hypothetical protein [Microbacterium galbinum]|jgi:hypothetical protein|uniref:Integral membrane protein n=1 Tax=Microbacterium galbinum TaxID=2851646 RepID=A0ABY4IQW9_9MICO|nr:hypothetical protein [Microbacterium galbinum]MCK2029026.1 hypothetical protein [Microbacterium galbinum]UPL15181.1 hypothetical protein KV396_12130 [Microbacterium galbinum]